MTSTSRNQLRQQLRAQRRRLSTSQRHACAEAIAEHIYKARLFRHSRHIAFYLPNDGEVSLWPLIKLAWAHGKHCYLPIVGQRHANRLWFVPFSAETKFTTNRFGIPEPQHTHAERQFPLRRLDTVLLPLVAFDQHGHRLGMGGGFYDRSFAFLHQNSRWRKPRLIGAAYGFQQVAELPAQPWDVPLDGIVTEAELHKVR